MPTFLMTLNALAGALFLVLFVGMLIAYQRSQVSPFWRRWERGSQAAAYWWTQWTAGLLCAASGWLSPVPLDALAGLLNLDAPLSSGLFWRGTLVFSLWMTTLAAATAFIVGVTAMMSLHMLAQRGSREPDRARAG